MDLGLEDDEPGFNVSAGDDPPAFLRLIAPLLAEGTLVIRNLCRDDVEALPRALSGLSKKVTALVIWGAFGAPGADGCRHLFERLPAQVVRITVQPMIGSFVLPPKMARKVYLRPA